MKQKLKNLTPALLLLAGKVAVAQDVDFSGVESQVNSFISSALTIINVIGGLFCLIFIIRIAMAYWGGGEEGRQDAGGMIKKLVIGVIVWLVMYQVVNGIFGTSFG